ncbi:MAG: hypothetical protein ACI8RD_002084 [Bacillariaceae sp.]|jgi:hypothetical protein
MNFAETMTWEHAGIYPCEYAPWPYFKKKLKFPSTLFKNARQKKSHTTLFTIGAPLFERAGTKSDRIYFLFILLFTTLMYAVVSTTHNNSELNNNTAEQQQQSISRPETF